MRASARSKRASARSLREKLCRYDVGMIIGPAEATTWNLECRWDTGAGKLVQLLIPDHLHYRKCKTLWSRLEKSLDGWHAAYHADNIRIVARHLARAADYIIGVCYMRRALGEKYLDGDYGRDDEEQVDQASFLKQLKKDWFGTIFKHDVPNPSSLKTIRKENADARARKWPSRSIAKPR